MQYKHNFVLTYIVSTCVNGTAYWVVFDLVLLGGWLFGTHITIDISLASMYVMRKILRVSLSLK